MAVNKHTTTISSNKMRLINFLYATGVENTENQ